MSSVLELPASPTGRRERKKQETRAALMNCALRLVAERGLDHVTVEDIAEAADVSARTFFNYFSSKVDALTGEAVDRQDLLVARFNATAAVLGPLAALHQAMRLEADVMQTEREQWVLRMKVVAETPMIMPALIASGMRMERRLAEAVAALTGTDVDADLFPTVLVACVSTAFRVAVCQWAAVANTRPLIELLDESVALLAVGLIGPFPQLARNAGEEQTSEKGKL